MGHTLHDVTRRFLRDWQWMDVYEAPEKCVVTMIKNDKIDWIFPYFWLPNTGGRAVTLSLTKDLENPIKGTDAQFEGDSFADYIVQAALKVSNLSLNCAIGNSCAGAFVNL